jgi:hypothetical protein
MPSGLRIVKVLGNTFPGINVTVRIAVGFVKPVGKVVNTAAEMQFMLAV